ncbi:MAG TPA: DUF6644 family protein [Steroidobacteraceae bacterium]|nr:DUF6644 family protein [Steroidobacteraceae bacterium]
MSTLIQWAEGLEQSALGEAIGSSRYAFPVIEGTHLIGLSVAVGLLFITDLRLMGLLLKRVPVHTVLSQLRPWILGGFAVIIVSGILLFVAEASAMIAAPTFALKFAFMLLAGANAGYFEFVIAEKEKIHNNPVTLPRNVVLAGTTSLVLWSLVIICGRLIPYVPSW